MIKKYEQDAMAEGLAEGLAKGLAEGLHKGRTEEKRLLAKKMIQRGVPVNIIAEDTGLGSRSQSLCHSPSVVLRAMSYSCLPTFNLEKAVESTTSAYSFF
jgi:hypothetical protein